MKIAVVVMFVVGIICTITLVLILLNSYPTSPA